MLDTCINSLLFNDHKPKEFKTIDLMIVVYLLARHAWEQEVIDSWDTIAARLHSDRRTVGESLKRLEAVGWITRSKRYAFDEKENRRSQFKRASLTVLNLAALPDGTTPHSKPSPVAEKLAAEYHLILLPKVGVTKRQPKTWHKVNEHAAQQMIDALNGNVGLAYHYVKFAVYDSTVKKSARHGLREISSRLPKLRKEYLAQREAQEQQTETTGELANA
jgi:hypothetical protein